MGRGRAKAKQQKVARELKYNTHFTDLDALAARTRDVPALEARRARLEDADARTRTSTTDWTGTDR